MEIFIKRHRIEEKWKYEKERERERETERETFISKMRSMVRFLYYT
jgi:hypothetical protein